MPTNIEKALSLRFPPLAIFYARELPKGVEMPETMCSMTLIAQAAKGKSVALSGSSCSCNGSACGWGFDPMRLENFPGGRECGLRFLSTGNQDWETGREAIRQLKEHKAPKILIDEFSEGEGFFKTPELVAEWVKQLPVPQPEAPYLIIKPLSALRAGETPKVVSFLVNPDQLSALVVLANYANADIDNVRIPFGAGCACFGIHPFAEAGKTHPRAVVGLTDISARFYLRKSLGSDILSFTMPLRLYEEMEANAPDSFLNRFAWKSITGKM